MSSVTGPNYTPENHITFIVQWFRTWSELQKDDFVEILAQKLTPGSGMNGLVNGMQKLDTETKRVSLFSCQIKLFNEWWPTWAEADKETLTSRLKESDPKFWQTVQEELNGTRKKIEEDFFTIQNTNTSTTTTTVPVATPGQREDDATDEVVVISNGVHQDGSEEGDDDNLGSYQNGIANGAEEVEEEMEGDGPSG